MKKTLLALAACLVATGILAQNKALPSANVKTLEGQSVNVQELAKDKITVFSFWATWCRPCLEELEAIQELYPEWREKYDMQLVAVSVDDARQLARVKPLAANRGWEYIVVTDAAKEFQNLMNVANPPVTILVNKKGEIVYEHLGYAPGAEWELEEKIKATAAKK